MKQRQDGVWCLDSTGRVLAPSGCWGEGNFAIDHAEGVTFGCDGIVYTDDWTPAEKRELATEMIARWTRFGCKEAAAVPECPICGQGPCPARPPCRDAQR